MFRLKMMWVLLAIAASTLAAGAPKPVPPVCVVVDAVAHEVTISTDCFNDGVLPPEITITTGNGNVIVAPPQK